MPTAVFEVRIAYGEDYNENENVEWAERQLDAASHDILSVTLMRTEDH
jgi:hypothetical protein